MTISVPKARKLRGKIIYPLRSLRRVSRTCSKLCASPCVPRTPLSLVLCLSLLPPSTGNCMLDVMHMRTCHSCHSFLSLSSLFTSFIQPLLRTSFFFFFLRPRILLPLSFKCTVVFLRRSPSPIYIHYYTPFRFFFPPL